MKRVNIIHLGIGNVGSVLVKQIIGQNNMLKEKNDIWLRYCGLFNSGKSIFQKSGLTNQEILGFGTRTNNVSIMQSIKEVALPFILIDTTASDKTYSCLLSALRKGGSVVLSNKKPLTGSQKEFDLLTKQRQLKYETTVGAALPVISTLNDLISTGDKILEINGCFSGTLGYIFSRLEERISFSQAVKEAKEKGFTEPDPRDDLSGLDVARKALILARTIGIKQELSEINLQSLYPSNMKNLSVTEFMQELKKSDGFYKKKMEKAGKDNMTLRFVAKVTNEKCSVGLRAVEIGSDVGNLKGPDNLIVFKTKRYYQRPLVIKGPGAGVEVTASGVFADILSAAKQL